MVTKSQVVVAWGLGACACVVAWWFYSPTPALTKSLIEVSTPVHQSQSPVMTTSRERPQSSTAASAAVAKQPPPAFDQRNLFSAFQLAQSSQDLEAIEFGLQAWRTCAGYVGLGSWDLEAWLNYVLPAGLPAQEREKRARYGRLSSLRCAGFAGQTQANAQAEELSVRARTMGSSPESLRSAIYAQSSNGELDMSSISKMSCDVVQQYPGSIRGIRLISPALRHAAAKHSTHVLNSTSIPARNIAINLAFCDLDPEGCNIHSDFVGSACIQSGQCSYEQEEDYWRATTRPADYAAAQQPREAIVQLVMQRNCVVLFE